MNPIRRTLLVNSERTILRFRSIAARLGRAESEAVTGLSLQRPSDGPDRWFLVHGLRSNAQDQARWKENLDRLEDTLLTADNTLSAASNTVKRAMELSIQLADETYGADERAGGALEVAELRKELLALANTKIGDRYVFSGDAYDGASFDDAGAYLGSAASHAIQVGESLSIESGMDGSAVFGTTLQSLQDFEAALGANDSVAISASIGALSDAFETLVASRTEIGSRQSRIADLRSVVENLELAVLDRLANVVAVDPAEAYTKLAELQTSYQSALQVTAATSGSSLFNYLR